MTIALCIAALAYWIGGAWVGGWLEGQGYPEHLTLAGSLVWPVVPFLRLHDAVWELGRRSAPMKRKHRKALEQFAAEQRRLRVERQYRELTQLLETEIEECTVGNPPPLGCGSLPLPSASQSSAAARPAGQTKSKTPLRASSPPQEWTPPRK